jgi:AmmeMemoRadiSam system protein A
MIKLTNIQKAELLVLARAAIIAKLEKKALPKSDSSAEQVPVFVSIYNKERLRGCMGGFTPKSLSNAIVENAAAATKDERFEPLQKNELAQVTVEISIPGPLQKFSYTNCDDLIEKLKKTKPGLIIKIADNKTTFLPQIWRRLSNPELFLSELCKKANLPKDAWKTSHLEFLTYRAEVFSSKASDDHT